MNYDKMPILKSLMEYNKADIVPFHIPGHKKGRVYEKLGMKVFEDIMALDTTEVPGIDNLHCPEGAILEAQELAAKAFGADYTFFLANGTSSGICSMILASTEPGDRIIVPRNCHRSVAGAIILGRLIPVYINPEVDYELGIAMGVTPETIESAILKNPTAKAVVITSPTYYGVCSDIKTIADLVHKYDKILLVDEAHGAHFGFNTKLPIASLEAGADMVAQSIHKTLPSMTQTSMLHVKSARVKLDKLRFFLQLMQTTSPSHVLLSTLDMARYIMEEKGEMLLDEVIEWSSRARAEINQIEGLYCLGRDRIGSSGIFDIDPLRFTVNFRGISISGTEADQILRKNFKIQVEMADLYNIVAITTVGDRKEDYESFVKALGSIAKTRDRVTKPESAMCIREFTPEMALLPWEAVYREKEMIDADDCIGRISGEMLAPYPPGIPVIMPGELINSELMQYLKKCVESGISINGASYYGLHKVSVIKQDSL